MAIIIIPEMTAETFIIDMRKIKEIKEKQSTAMKAVLCTFTVLNSAHENSDGAKASLLIHSV